ncbi:hypothetical protein EYC80_006376 [Monilinia laxa]|uniref:Cytochrome P450 n=1 Tax=Monilinia laxa TaxID=61186 RepID=A0A5N6JTM2_MONLA|nr:hypothetical protein EYC80_006376 [Monilinia laxa]
MNSYIRITFLVALPVPGSKVTLAVSLLFGAIICHLTWTRYHSGLHRIPGPFLASISSFWKWHVIWQEDVSMRSVHLHEKHGPLVRIGPNHVSVSSPEAIRVIHVENRGFPKATTYGILQPQLDGYDLHNIFSIQDVEYHSMHKRIIGGLYTTSALKDV